MSDEKIIPITCQSAAMVAIDEIHDLQGSLKTLPKENLKRLTKSIIQYGITFPLFVWQNPKDGKLFNIDGHQRVVALRHLKEQGYQIDQVPVSYITCKDESEARTKLLLCCSQFGRYDKNGLLSFVEKINNPDDISDMIDLSGIDLQKIITLMNEKTDPEFVPPAPPVPVTQRGDLWLLGEHRILCGDSCNPADVQLLLNGEKPLIMVTDPPYGVGYGENAGMWRAEIDGSTNRKTGTFTNDDRADWADAYRLFNAEVAYVYHGGLHAGEVQKSLEDCGYRIAAQLVWRKQHFALSQGAFHWAHEPIWYAVKMDGKSNWTGDRKQTTVWDIQNSNPFGGQPDDCVSNHPTQKPLECMARPIRLHGNSGDLVVDPFLGSGTTLIASHRENRRCYGMELSHIWVDVILQRYGDYTGNDPIRASDGAKFSELKLGNKGE